MAGLDQVEQRPERKVARLEAVRWLAGVVIGLGSVIVVASGFELIDAFYGRQGTTLQARIETLSNSLRDTSEIIAQIEEEVAQRSQLVSELERKARVAEQLEAANREQVEAISLLLRSELDRQEDWNFWVNVAQNAFFMILGAFLGHFVERWMSRRRATMDRPEPA